LLALVGCKRQKPHKLSRVWLAPGEGCALLDTGAIACWPRPHVFDPVPRDLVLGAFRTCALYKGGGLECGGVKLENASAVAVGGEHACAADTSKGVVLQCWGKNDHGQLGGPQGTEGTMPPAGLTVATGELRGLAAGDRHTCVAVTKSIDDGRDAVLCFGKGFGAPKPLLGGASVTALAAGAEHTCALMGDTSVRCWGQNDKGQLGDGSWLDAKEPVTVAGVTGAVQIAAGARFTCARLRTRTITCWGDNQFHQLANGTTEPSAKPVAMHGVIGVEELVAAGDSACVRLGDGDVRCWGKNDVGQLGDGTTQNHDVPMSVRLPRN
jgi:alpha-tubulin suppressor-like RCC1 family protein